MLPFFLVFGFAGIVKEMTAGINAIIKIITKDLSSGIFIWDRVMVEENW